jgi:hypothetical protein
MSMKSTVRVMFIVIEKITFGLHVKCQTKQLCVGFLDCGHCHFDVQLLVFFLLDTWLITLGHFITWLTVLCSCFFTLAALTFLHCLKCYRNALRCLTDSPHSHKKNFCCLHLMIITWLTDSAHFISWHIEFGPVDTSWHFAVRLVDWRTSFMTHFHYMRINNNVFCCDMHWHFLCCVSKCTKFMEKPSVGTIVHRLQWYVVSPFLLQT